MHLHCACYKEGPKQHELRRYVCRFCQHAGVLGCAKCRFGTGGCTDCRAETRPLGDGRKVSLYPVIPASERCGRCKMCLNRSMKQVRGQAKTPHTHNDLNACRARAWLAWLACLTDSRFRSFDSLID